MTNPFSITKAVDYSDKELNDFWVDFPGIGFIETIKPTLDMPMIILGSKGSGKTHIMKHFSFTMQRLRYEHDLLEGILKEGYIGTYLRCSGLNGYKFSGRGELEKTWETYFAYYLELWLGQLLINNVCKLLEYTNLKIDEKSIILGIKDFFDKDIKLDEIESLSAFGQFLNSVQREIDYTINNRAFTRQSISENIEVLLSPGSLIFGIPEILSERVVEFKTLKFLYLLDEYENFTYNQQKYFNTLIRERKNPTCFKIGSRRYGIRTTSTLSANEDIKKGSEYDQIDIDNIFRQNEKNYRIFIENICLKRLEYSGIELNENSFKNYFQIFDEEKFLAHIKGKGRKHLERLSSDLKNHGFKNESKTILSNIRFSSNILLERINILLLYRAWKKGKDLIQSSSEINNDCKRYYRRPDKHADHGKVLNKYKSDIIDSLYRENNMRVESYIGLKNLIKVSNGIPRHFLIIMKHIYRWNEYYEKETFKNNELIIPAVQLKAIQDTTTWFLEDARIPGKNGNRIRDCIERLCDYLRELRFSDLPPECSISTFSIDSKVVPEEISDILDYLEQYSYLIKIDSGRRNKNFNSRNHTYQVNGLLAVIWELSLYRRGIVEFNLPELKAIFQPDDDAEYKNLRNKHLFKYNAPFSSSSNTPTLFD